MIIAIPTTIPLIIRVKIEAKDGGRKEKETFYATSPDLFFVVSGTDMDKLFEAIERAIRATVEFMGQKGEFLVKYANHPRPYGFKHFVIIPCGTIEVSHKPVTAEASPRLPKAHPVAPSR